ncbi:MAG: hypothetical protein WD267_07335 [Balneolales bacterium]
MNYPIFNSIVKQIESELNKRATKIKNFRIWEEESINAAGLEFCMDLGKESRYLKEVSINLDWDKFREARLAKQLKGMEKHPLINQPHISNARVVPVIDVEVIWHFNENAISEITETKTGDARIKAASLWMDKINTKINTTIPNNNLVTRWHVEIEGDMKGKYLSNISLISYLQYELDNSDTLNSIHHIVGKNIQQLLARTNKIIYIAESTLHKVA